MSLDIQSDEHLLTVLRYVEQNPLRAGLVRRAANWPWSSAAPAPSPAPDDWPLSRPADWREQLDTRLPAKALERLRLSAVRGRPYGDDGWTETIASRLDLGHTLRDPWRPKKKAVGKRTAT